MRPLAWTRAAKSLGWIWVIDGLLQLQPSQFSSNFAVTIEMNSMAQPPLVAHLELLVGHFVDSHPAPWTVLIGAVQVLLGAGMLVSRSCRVALAASIAWALAVWAIGEGFGSVATGFALAQTGAPGAALVYALIAGVLLAKRSQNGAVRLRVMLRGVWTMLWLAAAALQLGSPISRSLVLRANFDEAAAGEPGILASLDHHLAGFASSHATGVTAVMVVIDVCLALLPWRSARRSALWASLGVLALGWVVGENLGGLLTWSANDVGVAPIFALIAFASFPTGNPHRKIAGASTDENIPGKSIYEASLIGVSGSKSATKPTFP